MEKNSDKIIPLLMDLITERNRLAAKVNELIISEATLLDIIAKSDRIYVYYWQRNKSFENIEQVLSFTTKNDFKAWHNKVSKSENQTLVHIITRNEYLSFSKQSEENETIETQNKNTREKIFQTYDKTNPRSVACFSPGPISNKHFLK